jgi:4-diphosphocytidyl-2-C-methyl-D-erythritol kinase
MLIKRQAPAKINLTLEVLNKRDDGFHDICSVMQTMDLCDILTVSESSRVQLKINFDSLPEWDSLKKPDNGSKINDNLAYQAAVLFKQKTGCSGGAVIQLEKQIPSAMGLGGGSSDAAAILLGLNELWGTGLSNKQLAEMGANLGSDIPFFIYGGTCLVEGRGEKITPLKTLTELWTVLLIPSLDIPRKTRTLYSYISAQHYTAGDITRNMVKAINNGKSAISYCWNIFTDLYPDIFPESEIYFQQFAEVGAEKVHICGSGPAIYYPATSREEAQNIAGRLKSVTNPENEAIILLNKL